MGCSLFAAATLLAVGASVAALSLGGGPGAAFADASATKNGGRLEASPVRGQLASGPWFQCGTTACDARESYCETINTDVPALPSTYACKPLPPVCRLAASGAAAECACFPRGTRCDFCTIRDQNRDRAFYRAFYRTCIGGH